MKIFVTNTATQVRLEMDFPSDMSVGDVMMLVECDTNVPSSDMQLLYQGRQLQRTNTLQSSGLAENAEIQMVQPSVAPAGSASAAAAVPMSTTPSGAAADNSPFAALLQGLAASYQSQGSRERQEKEQLLTYREQLRNDPYTLSMLKQNDPELADAILGDDEAKYMAIMRKRREDKIKREREIQERNERIRRDPFGVEAQQLLEEQIRQENVERLRQDAIEHMPESFGSVIMLYVDVVVNGVPLKAFVDSGAQMTIMSAACAERVGLMRLLDTRFAGTAVGVGTQKILGRVHMYEIVVANSHLPTSFSILEKQDIDLLIGLDMLKRHQCIIDLKEGLLRIGTTGESAPFLQEKDLPECAKQKMRPAEPAATAQFPDEHISQLMGLGFTREQAIEGLAVSNGNPEAAASYLLSMQS